MLENELKCLNMNSNDSHAWKEEMTIYTNTVRHQN